MGEERFFDIGHLMKLNFEEWSNVEIDLAAKKIWVGHMKLLAELGNDESSCTQRQYEDRFDEIMTAKKPTYIIVIEDESAQTLVACGTLTIRYSMFHQNGIECLISDQAVDKKYRRMYLGKLITAVCLKMADSFGDCEVCLGSMVPAFHEKLGWREVNLKPYHQLWESDTSQRDCSLTQVKGDEGDYMLHPEVLKALNLHDSFPIDSELKFQINRSRLLLRPLRLSDYREGRLQSILYQLDVSQDVEQFEAWFDKMKECGDAVIAVEELNSSAIAACVTVVQERRFNKRLEYRLRSVDWFIDERYRAEDLVSILLITSQKLAIYYGCNRHLPSIRNEDSAVCERLGYAAVPALLMMRRSSPPISTHVPKK